MEKITLKTARRMQFMEITGQIQAIVARSNIPDGVCFLFCPHTTAGLTVNENADPSVSEDMVTFMTGLIPRDAGYTHSEGNSDSHIKASLFGPCLNILIEDHRLQLGRWQGIYFCENDGPRKREVWVKIMS